jgi:hypothetical protein
MDDVTSSPLSSRSYEGSTQANALRMNPARLSSLLTSLTRNPASVERIPTSDFLFESFLRGLQISQRTTGHSNASSGHLKERRVEGPDAETDLYWAGEVREMHVKGDRDDV